MDPMCEVVILVEHPDDVVYVQRRLVEVFSPNVLAHVNTEGKVPYIAIPGFETWVKFRVVDTRSDLLSQSGSIAGRSRYERQELQSQLSPIKRNAVRRTIAETKRLGDETVYDNAAAFLPDPSIKVFTPAGEEIELPKGATVLDFAAAIHQDVLRTMTGAFVRANMTAHGHSALPTEVLEDGQVIKILCDEFQECLLDPMHICFVTDVVPDSAKKIRRALREGFTSDELESLGRKVVRELGQMLGLLSEDKQKDNSKLMTLIMALLTDYNMYRKKAFFKLELDSIMDRMRKIDEEVGELSSQIREYADNDEFSRDVEAWTLRIASLDAEWEDIYKYYLAREALYEEVEREVALIESGKKVVKRGRSQKRLKGAGQVRRDIACGQIVPLELLANSKDIDFGKGLEVTVDLPHEDNAHKTFLQDFATDMISFNYPSKVLEVFEGEDGVETGRFLIRLELPKHDRSSNYEVLKWVWRVHKDGRYNIKIASSCFEDACAKVFYKKPAKSA